MAKCVCYASSSKSRRLKIMEAGRSLVCGSKCQQGGVTVKSAKESQTHRGTRSADAVVVAVINKRGLGRIFASETVRDDY